MKTIKCYLFNLFIAFDQLLNTIFGGDPDETISSRMGKTNSWIGRAMCWLMDKIDKNHCARVREDDEGGHGIW
jgi:hypothetical protein